MSAKRMRQVERGSEAGDSEDVTPLIPVKNSLLGSGHHVLSREGAINIRTKESNKGSG